MRSRIGLVRGALLAPLVVSAMAACSGGDAITWEPTIEAAMTLSARDQRPVILYFTFDT